MIKKYLNYVLILMIVFVFCSGCINDKANDSDDNANDNIINETDDNANDNIINETDDNATPDNIIQYSGKERMEIIIQPEKTGAYYIFIPILKYNDDEGNDFTTANGTYINKKGLEAELMGHWKIKEGTGNFTFLNSTYGKMLNISSSDQLILEAYMEWNEHGTPYFGYELDSQYCYISDSNVSNITINITFQGYSNFSAGYFEAYSNFNTNGSWQEIDYIMNMQVDCD